MNKMIPLLMVVLMTSEAPAQGDIALPGLGEQDDRRWLPVSGEMSPSAYQAATRNNIKVLGGAMGEYLADTGVPDSMVGVAGTTIRLFSGDEITLFNSQGLSVNTKDAADEGGAYLNYSLDW